MSFNINDTRDQNSYFNRSAIDRSYGDMSLLKNFDCNGMENNHTHSPMCSPRGKDHTLFDLKMGSHK